LAPCTLLLTPCPIVLIFFGPNGKLVKVLVVVLVVVLVLELVLELGLKLG
jgi:hypothetical protein